MENTSIREIFSVPLFKGLCNPRPVLDNTAALLVLYISHHVPSYPVLHFLSCFPGYGTCGSNCMGDSRKSFLLHYICSSHQTEWWLIALWCTVYQTTSKTPTVHTGQEPGGNTVNSRADKCSVTVKQGNSSPLCTCGSPPKPDLQSQQWLTQGCCFRRDFLWEVASRHPGALVI